MPENLHSLPKIRESLTFLYVEKANIEQDSLSVILDMQEGSVPVPVASLTVLMLGPGTTITHAAIKTITDNGCSVVWCGERGAAFYASGKSETRSAANLIKQANACMDETSHMQVVRKMYIRRFSGMDCSSMTLQQIRGLEGVRMREAYKSFSKIYKVPWNKRTYNTDDWDDSDSVNRALSYGNAILYALCEAAIVSLGYSPGLGFVHTGKLRSFVYDIADLYKAETTIPAAFEAASRNSACLEADVRNMLRKRLHSSRVMARRPIDIAWSFELSDSGEQQDALPVGELWDIDGKTLKGGRNYASSEDDEW